MRDPDEIVFTSRQISSEKHNGRPLLILMEGCNNLQLDLRAAPKNVGPNLHTTSYYHLSAGGGKGW